MGRGLKAIATLALGGLAVLIALASISATTQAADDRAGVDGVGLFSCGKWIEARQLKEKGVDAMLAAWVQGFLSGMNTQRVWLTRKEEMYSIPDQPSLLAYVDQACADKPLDMVYSVTMQLYKDIQKP